MNIALIGYGKMGHAIERVAQSRGHRIVCAIDAHNLDEFDSDSFRNADVAIEFTTPASAPDNVIRCLRVGVPVVCGSTGWTARLPEVSALCRELGGSMLWSSNFSLGVNIFFALNRQLARLMGNLPEYRPELTEIHHIHKLDHPSGTAITLAEDLIDNHAGIDGWTEDDEAVAHNPNLLPVHHRREGEVPGTHIVSYDSPVDVITIEHRAKSRDGFALGAVVAAEWLPTHPGYRTMNELMRSLLSGYPD